MQSQVKKKWNKQPPNLRLLLLLLLFPPPRHCSFAISLAIGITPEMLPIVLLVNLSRGARVMAKHGVIVKRLNAVANFGSMVFP